MWPFRSNKAWRRDYLHFSLTDYLAFEGNPVVSVTEYPYFAYPDLYRAIEHLYEPTASRVIRTDNHQALAALVGAQGNVRHEHFRITAGSTSPWFVGHETEAFFHLGNFWLCRQDDQPFVVRLYQSYSGSTTLEVAAQRAELGEQVVKAIRERATEHSVYRGQLIEVAYTEAIRDSYGEQTSPERIELNFHENVVLTDDEIILDDGIKQVIKELIFDYEAVKDRLADYNIRRKRGVIFHGPPGTGKTFTTKYIAGRLPERTTIICHGRILAHIKTIANIAKLLSPATVVLEDVDLAFAQRESNFDQKNLSEFMDILDGHAADRDVLFILNTNSLERVEEAIKDRPGRISQCIFMGAPATDLRARYFAMLARTHNARLSGLDRLVAETDNCTQAFIKEFIVRCIQKQLFISGQSDGAEIELDEDLCLEVLRSMRSSGDESGKILGFVID